MKRIIGFKFLLLLLALTACVKEEEFQDLEPVNYTGEWGAPLVNSSITFEQLLASYENNNEIPVEITIDDKDVYHLIYRDTVESPELESYYKIQDVLYQGEVGIPEDKKIELPFGVVPFSTVVKFDTILKEGMSVPLDYEDKTITSASLKYVDLKEGELLLNIQSDFQHDVKLTLVFNSLTKDNVPLTIPIDLKYSEQNSLPVISPEVQESLIGYRLDLTSGGTTLDTVTFDANIEFTTIQGNKIASTDHIDVKLDLQKLKAYAIVGTLGEFKIPISKGSQGISVFDEDVQDVKIQLLDPAIDMHFTNKLGVPFGIEFQELSLKNAAEDTKNIELVDGTSIKVGHVNGIENFGTAVETKFSLTNESTKNLTNAFEIAPNEMTYDFLAVVGDTTNPDFFVHEQGDIKVALNIDLPLAGAVEKYVFEDEMEESFFSEFDTSIVESAEIRIVTDNGWPFTVKLQGYFVDDAGTVLDSLFTDGIQSLIQSGTIDNDGFVTAPKTQNTIIIFDRERYKKLATSTKIRYKLSFNTGVDGSNVAKILSTYKLGLKLAGKVKMDADLSSVSE